MITFKKYNSIENTYDKEFMEKIRTESPENMQFVVQEKVHGANFSFITDGETVFAGKRTGLIEADEKFYDYEKLLERYSPKVLALFTAIKQKYPDTLTVTVYGEIFGGNYPHSEVNNDSKIICIQKGVYYCPNHEFYAYDLYVTDTEIGRYFSVAESNLFFEQQAFFYAKTLLCGTLEECLQYSNEIMCVRVW